MNNINIDLSGLNDVASLSAGNMQDIALEVVEAVTDNIEYNWRQNASRGLKSTRQIYLRGLQKPEITVNGSVVRGTIALIGRLANMIEDGAPPFDMKEGFKASAKVKQGKNGWYLTIPFRFATPLALGENEAFSARMPKQVWSIAKHLDAYRSKPAYATTGWGSMKNIDIGKSLPKAWIPSPYNQRKVRPAYGSWKEYKHKSSIYEGMIKEEKVYEKRKQFQYFTFRRVSANSDPNAWIHPGFIAAHFAEKAVQQTNIDLIAANVSATYLNSLNG